MRALTAAVAAFLFLAPTYRAIAQQLRCGGYEPFTAFLAQTFGEHLFRTIKKDDVIYESWINERTGTYTVLMRYGSVACLLQSGQTDPKNFKTDEQLEGDPT